MMITNQRIEVNQPTYVIGDLHGCFYTLQRLIAKLPKEAKLIFVGDLCDRGLYTKEVIAFIKAHHYPCVLGNHDLHMIKHLTNALQGVDTAWNTTELFSGDATVQSYQGCDQALIDEHIAWLQQLPAYIQINEYFITHGFGLPYYLRKDQKRYHFSLRTNRISSQKHREGWEEDYEAYKVINIFGHDTFDEVLVGSNYYGIDTGCKYGKRLTAIELGSMKSIDVEVDLRDF